MQVLKTPISDIMSSNGLRCTPQSFSPVATALSGLSPVGRFRNESGIWRIGCRFSVKLASPDVLAARRDRAERGRVMSILHDDVMDGPSLHVAALLSQFTHQLAFGSLLQMLLRRCADTF